MLVIILFDSRAEFYDICTPLHKLCDYSCIMFLSVFRSGTFTAPGHPAGSLKKPPQHQDIQLKTTEPED